MQDDKKKFKKEYRKEHKNKTISYETLVHTYRETGRETDKEAGRETDKETGREATKEAQKHLFLTLDKDARINLLLLLSTREQEQLITNLSELDLRDIIQYIQPDDLVDLFQNLSAEVREAVWNNIGIEHKKQISFLLRFDSEDAAGLMTPRYVQVRDHLTVKETIHFIRTNREEVETIYYIYVVDSVKRLKGVVSLRDLMKHKDETKLSAFMTTSIISASEDTDQEEVARILEHEKLLALPVLDALERIIGIVTVDDVIDVIREEQTEDVLNMSAVSTNKQFTQNSYIESPIHSLFVSRIPWLLILLLAGTITSNLLTLFSPLMQSAVFLVWFIPAITSAGGNTATQSSALIIRGLARNELSFRHLTRVFFKELLVTLFLGMTLAGIMMLRGLFFVPAISVYEALIVSCSLLFVVIFSGVMGVLIPLFISKLRRDPTVIASPLLSTLIDLAGLTIYFLFAQLMLGRL